jgi:hypothetical protein
MPAGWKWGDDPMARWHSVGITITDVEVFAIVHRNI